MKKVRAAFFVTSIALSTLSLWASGCDSKDESEAGGEASASAREVLGVWTLPSGIELEFIDGGKLEAGGKDNMFQTCIEAGFEEDVRGCEDGTWQVVDGGYEISMPKLDSSWGEDGLDGCKCDGVREAYAEIESDVLTLFTERGGDRVLVFERK